jgi:hypothetical protein
MASGTFALAWLAASWYSHGARLLAAGLEGE